MAFWAILKTCYKGSGRQLMSATGTDGDVKQTLKKVSPSYGVKSAFSLTCY